MIEVPVMQGALNAYFPFNISTILLIQFKGRIIAHIPQTKNPRVPALQPIQASKGNFSHTETTTKPTTETTYGPTRLC